MRRSPVNPSVPNLRFVSKQPNKIRSTTILCVRRDGKVVMAGDGQVTLGSEVLKASRQEAAPACTTARSSPDSPAPRPTLSLCSRASNPSWSSITAICARSVVELAKEWRTDRMLRHLEALLLVADTGNTYIVSGTGDVIEPDDDIAAIGSGGPFAKCRRHRADRKYETYPRARSSKSPWRSPARPASIRMRTSSTRSWADGDLSSRASRRRHAGAG